MAEVTTRRKLVIWALILTFMVIIGSLSLALSVHEGKLVSPTQPGESSSATIFQNEEPGKFYAVVALTSAFLAIFAWYAFKLWRLAWRDRDQLQ
jgi:hypothetical protein